MHRQTSIGLAVIMNLQTTDDYARILLPDQGSVKNKSPVCRKEMIILMDRKQKKPDEQDNREWIFTHAPAGKAYMKFALPVIFGMVITLVYNIVDTYFITLTGNTPLIAGVSLVSPVFTLMIAFGDIWGLGGSSLISRLFGKGDEQTARSVSAFCFWAAILWGILVSMVMLAFRSPILRLLGAKEDTMSYASSYYTWIVAGAASVIFSLAPNNILRTEGLAKEAMAGSAIGSVINMILDPLMIFGLGMGAAGAAIATVIGNLCGDFYYVWIIMRRSRRLSMDIREIHIRMSDLFQILTIGIPASATNIMQGFSIALTNRCLVGYGTECLAAMGISSKIYMVPALIIVGYAFGGQPLIGFNYGAGNRKRMKSILRFAYSCAVGLSLSLTLLMWFAAPYIIRSFTQDPVIFHYGIEIIRAFLSGLLFMSLVLVTVCTFQSMGKAGGAFILSISRQGIVFAAAIMILSRIFGYTGIIYAQSVSDFCTSIIAGILLYRIVIRSLH